VRFFTLDWWRGIQDGALSADPGAEYHSYLETIRDEIPRGLLALQESVSLHDGHLRELELTPSDKTLMIIVDGDDGSGAFRRYCLRYFDVSLFRSTADPAAGLGGPRGYGDWGYDEAAVVMRGRFQHSILFSSGIEIIVQFAGFELGAQDAA
jgi:hypothetical protein